THVSYAYNSLQLVCFFGFIFKWTDGGLCRNRDWFFTALLYTSLLWGQDQGKSDMQGMEMSGMDHDSSGSGAHAMHSMEGRHMDMGPHMKMTAMREIKPGDQEKANQVVEAARKVADEYKDYKKALADGYKIFLPNVPQKQYHFTNYQYGF